MLSAALNNTLKIIAILLGVLWTIGAIPPVINAYYYLDELTCTDDGCSNYEIWTDDEELLILQEEIDDLEQRLSVCTALVENSVKK
mgnify:FL=1